MAADRRRAIHPRLTAHPYYALIVENPVRIDYKFTKDELTLALKEYLENHHDAQVTDDCYAELDDVDLTVTLIDPEETIPDAEPPALDFVEGPPGVFSRQAEPVRADTRELRPRGGYTAVESAWFVPDDAPADPDSF